MDGWVVSFATIGLGIQVEEEVMFAFLHVRKIGTRDLQDPGSKRFGDNGKPGRNDNGNFLKESTMPCDTDVSDMSKDKYLHHGRRNRSSSDCWKIQNECQER